MQDSRSKAFVCLMAVLVMLLGLALPLLFSNSPAAAADGYTWTDTQGPGYGSANALVYISVRNELYRGTGKGVFRQTPGAGIWTETGGAISGKNVNLLAWDGSFLYAATGTPTNDLNDTVWRYDFNTSTWTDISAAINSNMNTSFASGNSGLYVGTYEYGVWYYNPNSGKWTDTGGGMSDYYVKALVWDGKNLYAGTSDNGVWRYNPGTGVWTDTGGGMSSYTISSLAWDGSRLYAGTDNYNLPGNGVWRYDPITGNWTDTGGAVNTDNISALYCVGSDVYAGTAGYGVWRYDRVAGTWTDTKSMAGNASSFAWDGSYLYAGGYGVWRYDPATGTWSATGGGVGDNNGVQYLAWSGSSLYAAPGLVWSYDPAKGTWTAIGDPGGSGTVVGPIIWGGSWLWAVQAGRVLRFDPATATWASLGIPDTGLLIGSLAWDGSGLYTDGSTGFYRSPYINYIFRFDNLLNFWNVLSLDYGFAPVSYNLTWDGSGLYVAPSGGGISRYDPHVPSWTDVSGAVGGHRVRPCIWDGSSLYAGIDGNRVWHYSPANGTWTDISGAVSGFTILSLAWDGSGLFAGTKDHGVWRYGPATGSWTDVSGAVGGYTISSLAWDGSSLYAGIDGHGVWRYSYQGPPMISSLSPTSAWPGAEVTIKGAGFGGTQGSSYVSFGSTKATDYGSWSDNQIKCKVPAIATGSVQVSMSVGGNTSNRVPFTVTQAPTFQVTSISPNQGSQLNFSVDISVGGTGFQPGATVELRNGTATIEASNVNVVSDTQITGSVFLWGAAPGSYDVVVIDPQNQEAKLTAGFTVTNVCGQGAGTSVVTLGFALGLLSLAGSSMLKKHKRKS